VVERKVVQRRRLVGDEILPLGGSCLLRSANTGRLIGLPLWVSDGERQSSDEPGEMNLAQRCCNIRDTPSANKTNHEHCLETLSNTCSLMIRHNEHNQVPSILLWFVLPFKSSLWEEMKSSIFFRLQMIGSITPSEVVKPSCRILIFV
jgi:hypothetical protein